MGLYRRKSLSKDCNSPFFNKITKLADEGNAFSLMYLVNYKAFNKVLPHNAIQIILGTKKYDFPDNWKLLPCKMPKQPNVCRRLMANKNEWN